MTPKEPSIADLKAVIDELELDDLFNKAMGKKKRPVYIVFPPPTEPKNEEK